MKESRVVGGWSGSAESGKYGSFEMVCVCVCVCLCVRERERCVCDYD